MRRQLWGAELGQHLSRELESVPQVIRVLNNQLEKSNKKKEPRVYHHTPINRFGKQNGDLSNWQGRNWIESKRNDQLPWRGACGKRSAGGRRRRRRAISPRPRRLRSSSPCSLSLSLFLSLWGRKAQRKGKGRVLTPPPLCLFLPLVPPLFGHVRCTWFCLCTITRRLILIN